MMNFPILRLWYPHRLVSWIQCISIWVCSEWWSSEHHIGIVHGPKTIAHVRTMRPKRPKKNTTHTARAPLFSFWLINAIYLSTQRPISVINISSSIFTGRIACPLILKANSAVAKESEFYTERRSVVISELSHVVRALEKRGGRRAAEPFFWLSEEEESSFRFACHTRARFPSLKQKFWAENLQRCVLYFFTFVWFDARAPFSFCSFETRSPWHGAPRREALCSPLCDLVAFYFFKI